MMQMEIKFAVIEPLVLGLPEAAGGGVRASLSVLTNVLAS